MMSTDPQPTTTTYRVALLLELAESVSSRSDVRTTASPEATRTGALALDIRSDPIVDVSDPVPHALIGELLEGLDDLGPILRVLAPRRWEIRLSIVETGGDRAVQVASRAVRQAIDGLSTNRAGNWAISGVGAVERGARDRDMLYVDPSQIVGIAEIADLIGVSKQRASQLTRAESFPRYIQRIRSGPLYDREQVEEFIAKRRERQTSQQSDA